jgi:hypothetical protein
VRCAPARQLNATTEYTLSELELHKRKWSSPRLDAPFGKHRKKFKKTVKSCKWNSGTGGSLSNASTCYVSLKPIRRNNLKHSNFL